MVKKLPDKKKAAQRYRKPQSREQTLHLKKQRQAVIVTRTEN